MATRRIETLLSHLQPPSCGPEAPRGHTPSPASCFSDVEVLPPIQDTVWDFIVVGAGSSGCVVARRLSDAGYKTLLVEAGPDDSSILINSPPGVMFLQRGPYDWSLESTPEPGLRDRVMFLPRGRVLGGCSSINAMLAVRCAPTNYDGWAAAGCDGWDAASVLESFKKLETFHAADGKPSPLRGTDGPVHVSSNTGRSLNPMTSRFVAACEEVGITAVEDYNGASQIGVGVGQQTVFQGKRMTSSAAYLPPASRGLLGMCHDNFRVAGNLTVSGLTYVTRVVVEGGKATGVMVRRGSTDPDVLRRQPELFVPCSREVIACGGAYHSPFLLKHSGIGPAEELNAHGIPVLVDNPNVGENLQDHLYVMSMWPTKNTEPLVSRPSVKLAAVAAEYLATSGGPGSMSVLQGTAFYHSPLPSHSVDHAPTAPDTQFHFIPAFPADSLSETANMAACGPHMEFAKSLPMYGVTIAPSLLRPLSRGSVTLATGDPFAKPVIFHNYLSHPRDVAVLVECMKKARQVMTTTKAFAGVIGDEILDPSIPHPPSSDEYLEEYVRKTAITIYHPVGTAKMGAAPSAGAVVDPRCRVFGVTGLRVVDCAVMPFVPSGNTNLPAIMVGEHASTFILQDHSL